MQQIRIGWAERDVSSDQPLHIPGQFYLRVSTGVLDPVTVSALVLDNGEDQACFLSFDMVGVRACLVAAVRERVARLLPGFPVEKIVFNATHAHTGASYYERDALASMANPDDVPHDGVEIASSDAYREFLTARAADAVREAWERRAPGGIAYGYGYAVVAHSRRTVYFDDVSRRPGADERPGMMVDGHARMYGRTNDDRFSHYEAGADAFVNLLYTFDNAGRLTGAVVNVPAPSQCSEHRRQLSADYWHDVRAALRERHGPLFLLPQCAAAGDLSPRVLHYQEAERRRFRLKYGDGAPKDLAERRDIAERIAAAFDEVLEWAREDVRTELPLRHAVRVVGLSKRRITDAEAAAERAHLEELERAGFTVDGDPIERLDRDSILVARRNRCRRILRRYETQDAEPRFQMELHAVRVGEIAFVTNVFELYMDFMHRIQARSPFLQTFVVQLAGNPGDYGGYLCTARGAAGRGYSASLYCNQVSPEGGQELVEETVALLRELHAEPAPAAERAGGA